MQGPWGKQHMCSTSREGCGRGRDVEAQVEKVVVGVGMWKGRAIQMYVVGVKRRAAY